MRLSIDDLYSLLRDQGITVVTNPVNRTKTVVLRIERLQSLVHSIVDSQSIAPAERTQDEILSN